MKKSFKKAIAVLLAVLMVAFSVPFTAFAAPGDYAPDMDLIFGTFHAGDATSWTDYSTGSGKDYSMCGLFDVPVDFDATLTNGGLTKSGTLYIDAAKSAKAAEVVGYDALAEDYTLGVGDYFTCTVVQNNATKIAAMMAAIQYSNNIEPAGYYSYKVGRNTKYTVGTVSECAAAGGSFAFGGLTPIAAMSSEGIYGMNIGATGNATAIVTDGDGISYILDQESCQNGGDYIDVSSAYNEYFANPETGDLSSGYTYEGTALLETFVFKIVGEGDISFSVYDPYNTKREVFEGGYLVADSSDGIMLNTYTTYAINTCDAENDPVPGGPENPGSCKMTFFGKNVNVAGTECTHANTTIQNAEPATCTKDGYTGDKVCTDCGETLEVGTAIPAPGHNYSMVKTDATCTEVSTETYTCSECGDTYETHEDAALGHDFSVVVSSTAGDCQTVGTTTYKCSRCDATKVVDGAYGDHTPVSANNGYAANCTEDGKESDTVCSVCGETLEVGATITAPGHDYAMVKTDATCTEASTEVYTCTECGDTYETHVDSALGHDFSVVVSSTAGDCQTVGTTTYKCSRCDATKVVDGALGDHTPVSADNGYDANCTEDGKESDTVCSVCGETLEVGATITAPGHDFSVVVSSTTGDCQTVGTTTYKCSRCDATKVVDGAYGPHTEVSANNAVAPTLDAPGKEADTVCSVCGVTLEEGAVIPALEGVNITVEATDLGTTAINGEDATNGATVKVLKNSKVALTAAPVEGAEFVGWAINGKIFSTDATTTVTALANITYTPVFTETAEATFRVVFVDNYGNVISAQTVADASEIVAPTAPTRPGYTFKGWSVDYTTLTTGATIYAQFEKDAAATYTVTATGCTITTAAGATATDVMTDVAYDTRVTVTNNGTSAASWKIGDTTVAFGESYTFYVGSDVEVVPQFDASIKAVPTVSEVSKTEIVGADGLKRVVFLATRSMTDDCTYIGSGFVYGKAATATTTLDDVNGTTIKRIDNKTSSEQFSLTYGYSAQTGTMVVRAYLAYVDAEGVTKVIYTEPSIFTYTYA